MEFLELGGQRAFEGLSPALFRKYLNNVTPLITGLSSTYLYGHAREYGPNDGPDDLRGYPVGHFVALAGYDKTEKCLFPTHCGKTFSKGQKYMVKIEKLICSILLGIVTYDANLLIIEPKNTIV